MNYLIALTSSENGSRPPIQSWGGDDAPEGFALCDENQLSVFVESNGFVDLVIDSGNVTAMTCNSERQAAWKASLPSPPAPEPTAEEQMRADIDYLAAMTGVTL